jgi:hypothetical protein
MSAVIIFAAIVAAFICGAVLAFVLAYLAMCAAIGRGLGW